MLHLEKSAEDAELFICVLFDPTVPLLSQLQVPELSQQKFRSLNCPHTDITCACDRFTVGNTEFLFFFIAVIARTQYRKGTESGLNSV